LSENNGKKGDFLGISEIKHTFVGVMKTIKYIFLLLSMVLTAATLTCCDKLSDDDDAVADLLPGTWTFSYELQSEEETGLSFSYDHVIFRKDGTVSITYPDGQLDGKYLAGGTEIRIDGKLDDGKERIMHWIILSFSDKQVKIEYKFEFNNQTITALVTLDRTDDMGARSEK
jgi:hypothetical protein